MLFEYRYSGTSAIDSRPDATSMSFAPDTYRPPTYFVGTLRQNIAFREALSALHDVVVSDLRYKPRDTTAYREWVAQQEQIWLLDSLGDMRHETAQKVKEIQQELARVQREKYKVMEPFYCAQNEYFEYLYERDKDAWFVLDPVITVHPDEVFFECFSQDESSYGRVGCSYEVFQKINEFECGTTNVDYSDALYNEFQKIRDYKNTSLTVDPSGFVVDTDGEDEYKEVKIDLPDSWVRGFLQVSSAMTLPAKQFDLHPMDVYNFCLFLRRNKEKSGPRSMRFHLQPGEPIRVTFEPWNIEIKCPRSIYKGDEADEIRVWGRRRLLMLEQLIPVAKKFTVHLLGTGMPSFYVADLGDLNFTLGLSGWTANDWSRLGNFDLLAPRVEVDSFTQQRVFRTLKQRWLETPDALARDLKLDRSIVLGALAAFTQNGRAIFDLNKKVYRARELSREPLPLEKLRFSNPREETATQFINDGNVAFSASRDPYDRVVLTGVVQDKGSTHSPELVIDRDERLVEGHCSCSFYIRNKMYRGPCEHMLAVRMQFNREQLEV